MTLYPLIFWDKTFNRFQVQIWAFITVKEISRVRQLYIFMIYSKIISTMFAFLTNLKIHKIVPIQPNVFQDIDLKMKQMTFKGL